MDPNEVTRILRQIESGERESSRDLLPLVYEELRNLARARMSAEQPGQTLQATALVHEAYLRLLGKDDEGDQENWDNRGHFFGAAAEAMRRILIDRARKKQTPKLGGDLRRIDDDVGELQIAMELEDDKILALNEALVKLEKARPEVAELVKLRFFAGLPNIAYRRLNTKASLKKAQFNMGPLKTLVTFRVLI